MVTAVTVFSVLSFYLLVLLDAYLLSYSKIMMTITTNSNGYVNRYTLFLEMFSFFPFLIIVNSCIHVSFIPRGDDSALLAVLYTTVY